METTHQDNATPSRAWRKKNNLMMEDDSATVLSSEEFSLGSSSSHSCASSGSQSPRPRLRRMHGFKFVSTKRRPSINFASREVTAIENRCEILLADLQTAIVLQTEQEKKVRKALRVHTDRAKARYTCGTSMGAMVSLRKIHALQDERENMLAAIGYLRTLEHELESLMNGTSQTTMDDSSHSACHHHGRCCRLTASQLARYTGFNEHVQTILAKHSDIRATDEELLAELEHLTTTGSSMSQISL